MDTPKSYQLNVEMRPDYLYAHVKSDSSQGSNVNEYLKDITDKCREVRCNKVVIDNDMPNAFWVWDIFPVATRFPLIGRSCTKIAVVDKGDYKIENEEFTVQVGRRHGLDLHVFTNLTDAENWVMAD